MDLLPLLSPTPRGTQIQHDEGDTKLTLRLAIAEYHMADPKPKIDALLRRCSISHSTF